MNNILRSTSFDTFGYKQNNPPLFCSFKRVYKNPPVNAGDARDVGLIPGLGRSPGVGKAACSSIPARKNPWAEEPGGLQSMALQRVRHN